MSAALIIFNLAYLIFFGACFALRGNYEFILYAGVCAVFVVWIVLTQAKHRFPVALLWALSLWGFLHMAGGAIRMGDGVLYDLVLWPVFRREDVTVLRYDHAIHAYGFGVATWVGYALLRFQLKPLPSAGILVPLLTLIGMGFGALNEMLEFAAVLILKETGVGGYYNTAFDLLFNFIGALIAALWIGLYLRKHLHAS